MTVLVKRDGEVRAEVADSNEAFEWLLQHQGQSTWWAVTYEGWSVEDHEGNDLWADYKEAGRLK